MSGANEREATVWDTLRKDVPAKYEAQRKGHYQKMLTYIPWVTSWRLVKEKYPGAQASVVSSETVMRDGNPIGFHVTVRVTINGEAQEAIGWEPLNLTKAGDLIGEDSGIKRAYRGALRIALGMHGFAIALWEKDEHAHIAAEIERDREGGAQSEPKQVRRPDGHTKDASDELDRMRERTAGRPKEEDNYPNGLDAAAIGAFHEMLAGENDDLRVKVMQRMDARLRRDPVRAIERYYQATGKHLNVSDFGTMAGAHPMVWAEIVPMLLADPPTWEELGYQAKVREAAADLRDRLAREAS